MLHYLFVLGFLARYVACGTTPLLQWDPDTVADCVGWYDNAETFSCEDIRKLYGITPEEFHSWIPSVGLDCEPWSFQSYCIITQEKIDIGTYDSYIVSLGYPCWVCSENLLYMTH
jgi:hypothetical protein